MRRPVIALGLAGGCVLTASGALVYVFSAGPAAGRLPLALGLSGLGLVLIGAVVRRLRRGGRGSGLVWSAVLDAFLVVGLALAVLPVVAIVRGFVELFSQAHVHSARDAVAYSLAFAGLLLGGVFFAYAVKYYLSTVLVLLSALLPVRKRNGDSNGGGRQHASGLSGISRARNGNGHANGNGNGYHIDLGYHPFVSVHVAAYNEKRVIERLLTSLAHLEYPEYEVIVVDDSTDESVGILQRWTSQPGFKILHRNSRQGFKGGALSQALKAMDPRTEYVVVFDADSMPFPDSIDRFLPYFYEAKDRKSVV